jgi:hypothetical protein
MFMIEMTGKRFGSLVVLHCVGAGASGQLRWICQCDCGKEHEAAGRELRVGKVKSCGCKKTGLLVAANTTHGAGSRKGRWPEYRVWSEMIRRCENENCNRYYTHGARGIKVCERWRESFQAFINDMGRRPSVGLSIERRDNDGDYEPANCYWATKKEQARNKSNTRFLIVNGQKRPLVEWAEIAGVKPMTVRARLKRGLTPEEAIAK